MSKQALHDPSASPAIKRRVEATEPAHDQDQSLSSAAPVQSPELHRSSAHARVLQRLSSNGQRDLLLHLNRTQGNRQVQRLAQAMQRSQPSAPVVQRTADNQSILTPEAPERESEAVADVTAEQSPEAEDEATTLAEESGAMAEEQTAEDADPASLSADAQSDAEPELVASEAPVAQANAPQEQGEALSAASTMQRQFQPQGITSIQRSTDGAPTIQRFGFLSVLKLGKVKSLIGGLKGFVKNPLGSVKSLVKTVKNPLGTIKSLVKNVKGFVKNPLGTIKSLVQSPLNSIKSLVKNVKGFVKNPLGSVKSLWKNVKGQAVALFNNVKNRVTSAWKSVKGFVKNPLGTVKSFWKGIKGEASALFSGVKSSLGSAWQNVKGLNTDPLSALSTLWKDVKGQATTAFTNVKTRASSILQSVKDFAKDPLSPLKTLWKDVKGQATTAFNNVKTRVTSAWTDVKSVVTDPLGKVKSMWKDVKGQATAVFTDVKTRVTSAWTDLKGLATDPVNTLKALWESMKERALPGGTNTNQATQETSQHLGMGGPYEPLAFASSSSKVPYQDARWDRMGAAATAKGRQVKDKKGEKFYTYPTILAVGGGGIVGAIGSLLLGPYQGIKMGQNFGKVVHKESQETKTGRIYAVNYTGQFHRKTMGHLVHHGIAPWIPDIGDFAAGNIGKHYESIKDKLLLPVTKANITWLADNETKWWRKQKGLPWLAGHILDEKGREDELLKVARKLYPEGIPEK